MENENKYGVQQGMPIAWLWKNIYPPQVLGMSCLACMGKMYKILSSSCVVLLGQIWALPH